MAEGQKKKVDLGELLSEQGPVCLIVEANLATVSGEDRFQPAGFPQIGHVIYDAPRGEDGVEKVCIVDSAASMANHLESICLANPRDAALAPDLQGLPYVVCLTDNDDTQEKERVVTTTFKEGHRLASDYFLDGTLDGQKYRDVLRKQFGIKEVKKDKTYFTYPENWWSIFSTIFKYDPNSLVHGVLFAREQIKISRMLTAHLEAFGAKRVSSSGVKFDPLGKTTSGQPIFSVNDETAHNIRATFILDMALLRSYGRDKFGLNEKQKRLLLELALWKIHSLLGRPFRFRSKCFLKCQDILVRDETHIYDGGMPDLGIRAALDACGFIRQEDTVTKVYYPASELFKVGEDKTEKAAGEQGEGDETDQDEGDGRQ